MKVRLRKSFSRLIPPKNGVALALVTIMLNTHGDEEDGMIKSKSAMFRLQCKNRRLRCHDDDASENCGD